MVEGCFQGCSCRMRSLGQPCGGRDHPRSTGLSDQTSSVHHMRRTNPPEPLFDGINICPLFPGLILEMKNYPQALHARIWGKISKCADHGRSSKWHHCSQVPYLVIDKENASILLLSLTCCIAKLTKRARAKYRIPSLLLLPPYSNTRISQETVQTVQGKRRKRT